MYVYRVPFQRLGRYRAAATSAKGARAGSWTACRSSPPATAPVPVLSPPPPTQVPTPSGCHPNYTKCLPIVGDLDCAEIRAMGKAPVQVIGADPYRLDGDNDGLGCE